MENVYEVEYAGRSVRYSFIFPLTKYYFRGFIRRAQGEEYDIRVSPELFRLGRELMPEETNDAYLEYRLLIELTEQLLLDGGCCMFHSVAFTLGGRAWLLTAPSGTGKTTQYLNWQRLFPGEIEMICGDMPVLELTHEGVRVHATSWCGKENFGTKSLSAPLGGIVLLEQAGENELTPMEPHDAIFPFFTQFLVRPETEERILALAALMDAMLSTPLMRFCNLGDDASTEMLRTNILMTLEGTKGAANGEV